MLEKIQQEELVKYTSDVTKKVLFDSTKKDSAEPFYEVSIKVEKKDPNSHFVHPQTTETFTETWHVQSTDELVELVKKLNDVI